LRSKLLLVVIVGVVIGAAYALNGGMDRLVNGPGEPPEPTKPAAGKVATHLMGQLAEVRTNKGTFTFALYEKDMPRTTANFIRLAKSGFYNGSPFHRYVRGFVIQGGQPGPGHKPAPNIKFESVKGLSHVLGAVAMARVSGDYNSANSQFYICLAPAKQLDGEYAVFGQVIQGMDVVKKLRKGDKMISVTIKPPIAP
jgi:peptidyl-prolyl cis-trans isomerase B (cyclophilin B)